MTYTCSECGDIYTQLIDELDHEIGEGVYTAPECEKDGYWTYSCENCIHSYTVQDQGTALEHDLGTVTVPATCVVAGSVTVSCTNCDHVVVTAIPVLGHAWGNWRVVTAPTATASGLNRRDCTREGCTHYETTVTDPTGSNNGGDFGGPIGPTIPSGPVVNPGAETVFEDILTPLAAASNFADELYALKLFLGVGMDENDLPIFALESRLTRLQALVLTIRLLGLEEEAFAFEGTHPFTDVPDWGDPYVALAFELGITVGVSSTEFGSELHATCQQFTTFLMRALGYNDSDGDFDYDTVLEKALEIELYSEALLEELDSDEFLRADAVLAMVRALLTYIKGSDDTMLIDTLVEAEVFTQEDADLFIAAVARIDERGF